MASTAPVTGSTPGKIRTFLLDHERLVIVVVAAIALWWGYGKYAQIRLDHDNAVLKQAQIVADSQKAANVQLAQQVSQDAAQLKALSDKLEAQNQQLANANIALATALSQRQKTDATLPPSDLAQRWAQLAPNMPAGGVTVSPDNSMKVTQAGAVSTVQQLEKVPVLTQELANETTAKQNDDNLLVAANKNIFDLNGQVVGLNKLIVDNAAVCQDQIKVVKDEARKSKRRWFIIGYVAGFLSRQFLVSKGL
jgi:hypothetical protein